MLYLAFTRLARRRRRKFLSFCTDFSKEMMIFLSKMTKFPYRSLLVVDPPLVARWLRNKGGSTTEGGGQRP